MKILVVNLWDTKGTEFRESPMSCVGCFSLEVEGNPSEDHRPPKLDRPIVCFSTLILSVSPKPDLYWLINLISIDICVILLPAHSTTWRKKNSRMFHSFRSRMLFYCSLTVNTDYKKGTGPEPKQICNILITPVKNGEPIQLTSLKRCHNTGNEWKTRAS